MPNAWFRLYSEFATDPKVQMMSEANQRRFVMVLCLRCSNDYVTLQDDEVAFQLRISNEEWAATKAVFLSRDLINEDNSPTAWDKRQFVSDSSAERVARHRAKKKEARNVTVTPPDTETDTETEESTPSCPAATKPEKAEAATPIGFAEFWAAYPKKVGKGAAERAWRKGRINGLLPELLQAIDRQKRSEQWRRHGGQYIPNPATWINEKRWHDELPLQAAGPPSRSSPITREDSRRIAASTRLADYRAACEAEKANTDERTIETSAAPRILG